MLLEVVLCHVSLSVGVMLVGLSCVLFVVPVVREFDACLDGQHGGSAASHAAVPTGFRDVVGGAPV